MKVPSHDVSVLYNESGSEFPLQINDPTVKIAKIVAILNSRVSWKIRNAYFGSIKSFQKPFIFQTMFLEGIIKQANYFSLLVLPIKPFSLKTNYWWLKYSIIRSLPIKNRKKMLLINKIDIIAFEAALLCQTANHFMDIKINLICLFCIPCSYLLFRVNVYSG